MALFNDFNYTVATSNLNRHIAYPEMKMQQSCLTILERTDTGIVLSFYFDIWWATALSEATIVNDKTCFVEQTSDMAYVLGPRIH